MVGGSSSRPSAPSSLAYSAQRLASCHPVPCTPAMTSPRPATVSTATLITLRRSSSVRASYSPSDPFGPTPRLPLCITKSMCSRNLSQSTARPAGADASSLKARVVATTTPPRSKFLLMVFLSWCRAGIRGLLLRSVVFGSWCREFADADGYRDRSTVARRAVGELRKLSLACEQVFNGAPADAALADAEARARAQLE